MLSGIVGMKLGMVAVLRKRPRDPGDAARDTFAAV
jgi:hypothetical protein